MSRRTTYMGLCTSYTWSPKRTHHASIVHSIHDSYTACCIRRTQPHVRRTQPHVRRTQSHVRRTQPHVRRTQPHVRRTQPHVRRTQPLYDPPSVRRTQPHVRRTQPLYDPPSVRFHPCDGESQFMAREPPGWLYKRRGREGSFLSTTGCLLT